MKSEFVPKGYNSWLDYYHAKERRQKLLETIAIILVTVGSIAALIIITALEGI